jgi:hypothetical protein
MHNLNKYTKRKIMSVVSRVSTNHLYFDISKTGFRMENSIKNREGHSIENKLVPNILMGSNQKKE